MGIAIARDAARRFNVLRVLLLVLAVSCPAARAGFVPDTEYRNDHAALEALQRDAFNYIWEYCEPNSGMAREANYHWDDDIPIAVGGTGFGIAAIVVAADRGWITHEQSVSRLLKITDFLRDRTERKKLRGAFPHWIDGSTGKAVQFGERDAGADLVETSFLMQGLLIARAYFNGPGIEKKLRAAITELWEDVEWDWFSDGEENGLYWHWDPDHGFHHGLKILGYNECLVTYVLAAASPTHPISRVVYDYWTSGPDYLPRDLQGYRVEASPEDGGPLFLAHYSFIGLDPHKLADKFVPGGYFLRGVRQTLSNRGYCLYAAPPENRYAEDFWGLSAGHARSGYAVSSPDSDSGTVTPTAAISSMPYTPHYSFQVLRNLFGNLRKKAWGEYGPYDGISLRDDWVSPYYLAIDQLPMVCLVENYRSGLLWNLFMSDPDVRRGLAVAGLRPPERGEGFVDAAIALTPRNNELLPDAHDLRRHPDSGLYEIVCHVAEPGTTFFSIQDSLGREAYSASMRTSAGDFIFSFPQFAPQTNEVFTLIMTTGRDSYVLPVRFH